jgi:putative resolvase
MEEETYKPSAFARKIGVHIKTLQRWDKGGIFVARRTPTNRRYYTQEDYQKYRKEKK